MRILVSWLLDDGTATLAVEWGDHFREGVVPIVGDHLAAAVPEDEIDVIRVMERYTYQDEDQEDVWHLFVRHIDVPEDRRRAFELAKVVAS